MSKKFTNIAFVVIILLMAGFIGYTAYTVFFQTDTGQVNLERDKAEQRKNVLEETEQEKGIDTNETFEEEFELSMSETEIQNAIHAMSHQKVHADDKWSHMQITPERITRLIEVVEMNEDKYKHGDTYLEILHKWSEGDFSNSVYAHNFVWSKLGGTIGRAKRLLKPEEEAEYIDRHFE